jgi:ferrochelatase
VWTNEGSPLAVIAGRQAHALRDRFEGRASVHFAMRYGNPGIAAALRNMVDEGCTRILAAPLYPQYCAATTATANDAVFGVLASMRVQPALRTLPPYYDDPLYIEALGANLSRQLEALDFAPERLLLSFHGMPRRTLDLGDPYHCHCQKTARLLSEALGRDVDVAFQSRFGRAKWLEPATDATLASYPKKGVKRVAVATPGFAADCLETLEELGIRGRETFLKGGGEKFALLDCLNDSPESIAMLERLISRELAGWLEQT